MCLCVLFIYFSELFSVAMIVVIVAVSQVDDLNNLFVNLLSGKMLTSCEIKSTTFKHGFICHFGLQLMGVFWPVIFLS